MKKLIFILTTVFVCLFAAINVSAKSVSVIIPDYEFKVNDTVIEYKDSIYPLISYKDITYFPMTYEYCRYMNLNTSWVEGEGLWIAYKPRYVENPPAYEKTTQNKKRGSAQIPTYPIYINGEKIDNSKEEYPILNFRNVTYFPMTWKYAHEEFGWDTNWTDGVFAINKDASKNVYIDIMEQNDEYAIIRKGYPFNWPVGDGWWTTLVDYKYYKLSFLDDSLTETEYEEPNEFNSNQNRELEIKIEKNKIICEGHEFAEIDYLASGKGDESGFWMNSYAQTFGDVEIYNFRVYYNTGAAIVYESSEAYQFVKTENGFVQINGNMLDEYLINSAARIGDDIYICANKKHWKSVLWNEELFKISPDGTVTYVNELMPDHNSVNLIGTYAGKLYLENMWSPDNYNDVYAPTVQEVSAANDGLFSYDGTTLTKIAPFVHGSKFLMSSNGRVYALINWKDQIKRIH